MKYKLMMNLNLWNRVKMQRKKYKISIFKIIIFLKIRKYFKIKIF